MLMPFRKLLYMIETGVRVSLKTHASLTLPGMLSKAGKEVLIAYFSPAASKTLGYGVERKTAFWRALIVLDNSEVCNGTGV